MIWLDGKLVSMATNTQGHQWIRNDSRRTVTIDRNLAAVEPGPVNVLVSLWERADNNGRYLETTTNAPGVPAPFVLPTVPSALAVRPNILRTLFNCERATVLEDNLLADLNAAGVNALSFQVFNSPGDNPGWDTFEKWQVAFEELVGVQIAYCKANGLSIHAMGDGFLRYVQNLNWIVDTPWAPQAIAYVRDRLWNSGVCYCMDVVDEAWHDPNAYQPALGIFLQAWKAAPHPPIGFPQPATDLDHSGYEGSGIADYASRYATALQWRSWRETEHSVWENFDSTKYQTQGILPAWTWDAGNEGIVGEFYQKKLPGGNYQPGDLLLNSGARPSNVTTQIFLAWAYGASGFRFYGYDWSLWRNQRLDAVPGVVLPDGLQTGARPGGNRWDSLAAACNWMKVNEAEITTGILYEPVISGPWVFGRRGSLVVGINTGERALPSPLAGGVLVGSVSESSTVPAGAAIVWNHA